MNGIIHGKMAVLSFWNDAWLPFVCATDCSLDISSTTMPIRTIGDGHWNKVTYQNIGYSISLSGTLMYDPTNFTGMDMVDNQFGFTDIRFRLAMTDEQGDIQSFQGYIIVQDQTISFNATGIVKTALTLQGNGELQFFSGLIPCPAVITGITITGQTGASGICTVTYTYTGTPYQVKYRIDGTGMYLYALIGVSIVTPALPIGNHSIEIVAVCQNGYEADNSVSQAFVVTRALTCSAVCTAIGTSGTISPIFTGSPAQWSYSIDGGTASIVPIFVLGISTGGLSVGAHSVTVTPICANGALGTPFTQPFTISSNPAQSVINYNWLSFVAGNVMQIYVNSVLTVSVPMTTSGSGSIIVATGNSIRCVLIGNHNTGSSAELKVQDTTLSTVLSDQFGTVPTTLSFTFTAASGDTYSYTAIVSP